MKKRINKKLIGVIIVSIIMVVTIVLGVIFYLKNNKKLTTNLQFEYFGYNEYYENDSNTLSIFEASKVLTSIYAKIYDITEVTDISDSIAWQNYAYNMDLVSNDEYTNNLTYSRLYELIYDYEEKIRNVEMENVTNILNLKSSEFTEKQIKAINYLYSNNVITRKDINLELLNSEVNKKYFEDIVVKCIFKFNLLDLREDTVNYNNSLNMSQNKNYLFTTNNTTSKELRYKTLKFDNFDTYLNPKETYSKIRNDIVKISDVVNGYFDVILNIDYENMNEKNLYNNLKDYYLVSYNEIDDYCNYVKENNIKLSGKSNIIYPIIYYVDGYYYVRTKINYEVVNSNTNENILFGNIPSNYNYFDIKLYKDGSGWHITTVNLNDLKIK